MHQKQIELLRLLREATRNGQAVWRRADDDSHHTELAGVPCSLRFKHPLLAGDDGSDADAAEITANGTVWTFYAGTEGFNLIGEILIAAYPEIRQHDQQVAARLEAVFKFI
jgi:hypothetical protein